MEPVIYPLLLLVASMFLSGPGVQGTGVASVKLVHYSNPKGQAATGQCCDGGILNMCNSRCDMFFEVCLNDPTVSSDGCSVGAYTTDVTEDMNDIDFADTIGNVPNPTDIKFESWASSINLKVTVKDVSDATNTSQLVEQLTQDIEITPKKPQEYKELMLADRTMLGLQIAVSCDDNYYGPGCTTFCEPADNYNCSPEGEKICKEGWTGGNCTENTNECLSSPCIHGTCQDLVNAYKCNCEPGFLGNNCDQEADECSSSPCQNGGKCSDAINSFSCSCPGGFAGEHCEVKTAPSGPSACESNPCQSGATCQDDGTDFRCICPVERKGKLCESWIPHICDEKPCKNGGKCIRMGQAFKCSCDIGYYDVRCDRRIGDGAKAYKHTDAASTSGITLALLVLPVLLTLQ